MKRRDFLHSAAIAAATSTTMFAEAPTVRTRGGNPVVVSAANGNRFKNGGAQTAVERAFTLMTGGADVLDALMHAWSTQARGRRRGPRGRADAVRRRSFRHGYNGSPSARRKGRAGFRTSDGIQDRGRSQHGRLAKALARMEAPDRSGALSRSKNACAGVV